ncbi:MAG: SDR family NAD(P)-dependent oxidoreductase [Planctomycetales bacterium]|nr:SDR family NAD(P)-dependent oxidoreductase [Planctomycetales bacterium]MCA9221907.1 SDR family NAD(P)-dependent oxidoreductase [Planctomycetales bacterium]
MQLANATILVTGGGSGLGAGCVRHLSAAGANVMIADVNEAAAAAMVEQCGGRVAFQPTDVTNAEQVTAAIEAAEQRYGGLRGVVNCAGVLAGARVLGRDEVHPLELFERVIRVNLIGTFNVGRLAAAAIARQEPLAGGERGVIVNVSSVSAFEGQIGQAAYSASKGGVAGMTLPMARELARCGIRVVAVAPGIFETAMMQAAPAAVRDSLQEQTLFPPRFGDPSEFAAFVRQIFENSMLNGATLRLDGAVRMGPK